MKTYFRQILDELCAENHWKLKWISDNYIGILENGPVRNLLVLSDLGLNSSTARETARDKCATYAVLQESKIPAVEHHLIYHPSEHDFVPEITEFFQEHGQHIVIKNNFGSDGKEVFEITDQAEIPEALKKTVLRSDVAAICPFYDIKYEYRLILLDGDLRLAYRKSRGEDWRLNLYQGAKAQPVDAELLSGTLLPMALAAVKALNIRFCSVDIVELETGEFLVMEVNSTVFIERYLRQYADEYGKVKTIYRDALNKLLEI